MPRDQASKMAGNDPLRKGVGGRPRKYDAENHPRLAESYAIAGMPVAQIAKRLSISVSTFYEWKTSKKEFSEALASAEAAKIDTVTNSLYRRATGYEYKTSRIIYKNGQEKPERVVQSHHIPPDTSAAMAYLTNRDKENWSQKQVISQDVSESLADKLERARKRILEGQEKP